MSPRWIVQVMEGETASHTTFHPTLKEAKREARDMLRCARESGADWPTWRDCSAHIYRLHSSHFAR